MSTSTKKTPTTGITQHRKGKALLIALLNLNLVFALVVFKAADPLVAGQMITAILFLAGLYLGVQGGVDMTANWKADTATTKNTDEKITKNYSYKMAYADEKTP